MTLTIPHQLLFGYWGSAPFPWLMILSSAHRHNAALIAHESCHQSQQRRDGTLTFWWRYLTDKTWRLRYEAEAYKVWATVAPEDTFRVASALQSSYGFDITLGEALQLVTPDSKG